MPDDIVKALLGALVNAPAWLVVIWMWKLSIDAHKAAIDYYRAEVVRLHALLEDCAKFSQRE